MRVGGREFLQKLACFIGTSWEKVPFLEGLWVLQNRGSLRHREGHTRSPFSLLLPTMSSPQKAQGAVGVGPGACAERGDGEVSIYLRFSVGESVLSITLGLNKE